MTLSKLRTIMVRLQQKLLFLLLRVLNVLTFLFVFLIFVNDYSLTTAQQKPNARNSSKLTLTPVCSPEPAQFRVWRVHNSSLADIEFTWQVANTEQTGIGIALAETNVFFNTSTIEGPNTTRIFVNDEQHDVSDSLPDACNPTPLPTETPQPTASPTSIPPSATGTATASPTVTATPTPVVNLPGCPLNRDEAGTIADFYGWSIRADKELSDAVSGPAEVNLPAGRYEITLVSFDEHTDPGQHQPAEQWFLMFKDVNGNLILESRPISDLPDDQSQLIEVVERNIEIPSGVVRVFAVHSEYPSSAPNSVHPLCARFRLLSNVPSLPTATHEPTATPTPISLIPPNPLECPLGASASDILIQFSGDSIRADRQSSDAIIGPISIEISPGRYEITLVSYDEHIGIVQPQPAEQWMLKLRDRNGDVILFTRAISDLPDHLNQLIEVVEPAILVSRTAVTVYAFHLAYPNTNPNSIHPVCARLRLIGHVPTATVTPSHPATATITSTMTATVTMTEETTLTATATGTITAEPSGTPTATATLTNIATNTPTATLTMTPTVTPTGTITEDPTPTSTNTPTATNTPTSTTTATTTTTQTNMATNTPTHTPTATVTPTSTPDGCDISVPSGDVYSPTGLVAAINQANVSSGLTIICLSPGAYVMNVTQVAQTGLPLIISPIEILGNGAALMRDPSAVPFRIFRVISGGDLTLIDLSITGGNPGTTVTSDGGAIFNAVGIVTIVDSALTGNTARSGGAIFNDNGSVTITNSSVINNSAPTASGGGIVNLGLSGDLTIDGSNISDNEALTGGAISNSDGTLTIGNSSINNNVATSAAGGIFNSDFGAVVISDSVMSGNMSVAFGGAVSTAGSALTINNSCIQNNISPLGSGIVNLDDSDPLPPPADARFNWWGSADGPSGPGLTGSGDEVQGNVLVTPWQTTPFSYCSGASPPLFARLAQALIGSS